MSNISLCKNKNRINVRKSSEVNLDDYINKNVFVLREENYLIAGTLVCVHPMGEGKGLLIVYNGNKDINEFKDCDELLEDGSTAVECIEYTYIAIVPENITYFDEDKEYEKDSLNLLTYDEECEYYTISRIIYKNQNGIICSTGNTMFSDNKWVNFDNRFNKVDVFKFNFMYNIDFRYKNTKIKVS